jgi:hypothetical protein
MIKAELYPKTPRISVTGEQIEITEKLDGSNLIIFKLNEEIYFAQRNTIFKYEELEENKDKLYKGLLGWADDHIAELQEELYEGSCLCGEWLGMGNLKYTVDEFDKRFYMFAKARINEDFKLSNINYTHEQFIYPFNNQIIPSFIGIVPVVKTISYLPYKDALDLMYDKYCEKVDRPVEGFVMNFHNIITKYVRMKNGKLVEYSDSDHKGA